jgi:hypothetical protein
MPLSCSFFLSAGVPNNFIVFLESAWLSVAKVGTPLNENSVVAVVG